MIVSLLSENLQKKLNLVNHAVSSRSQLPILSSFLMQAKKGELGISATDLEVGIKTTIPAKVEKEGEVGIPAKIFLELVSNIPPGKITLETRKEGLELKGERVQATLQTTTPEDFPTLYQKKGEEEIVLGKEDVEKDLPRVVFAASQDMGRPALSGVLIKEDKGETLLVATDGYRLSLKKNALGKSLGRKKTNSSSMLVPSRVVREIVLMAGSGGDIKIYTSKESNQIIAQQEETILVGRLIEAEFPNFEKILPTDYSTRVVFDRDEMQKAVKTCFVFAKETANIIKLSIAKNKITASANTPSVGQNRVEVGAKTQGEENEIAFNARYLLDLFSNIEDEEMVFEMTGPLNPGVFKVLNDESFLHLIMPIRVQA